MKPFTLLHISDLHFGPHHLPAVAAALLRDAQRLQPDAIIASGDFTQRAKRGEFEQARDFLAALPAVPTAVTPGNHDVPLYRIVERLFKPWGNYREYIAEDLDQTLDLPDAIIVSLNTAAPRTAITNGWISDRQLSYAEEAFSRSPGHKAKIVVAHHHFAPAPDYELSEVMPKAKRALDRFGQCKVDMILGGHLHRAYIGNSLDVYAGGNRDHGIIIVQSGTSTSRRGRAREQEKNSFNLIRIEESEIHIAHYMYFSDLERFAPIAQHRFPRAAARVLPDADPESLPDEELGLAERDDA